MAGGSEASREARAIQAPPVYATGPHAIQPIRLQSNGGTQAPGLGLSIIDISQRSR